MFLHKLRVEYTRADGVSAPCPLAWIDNFAMRNFTNSAVFDDTLPTGAGRMEAGSRVPLDALQAAMKDWFRRKGYLRDEDRLQITAESGRKL